MEVAMAALEDMLAWFSEEEKLAQDDAQKTAKAAISAAEKAGKRLPSRDYDVIRPGGSGVVAVYDATNSTKERRTMIKEECNKNGVQVMFIESVCDEMEVIVSNIREVYNSPLLGETDFY